MFLFKIIGFFAGFATNEMSEKKHYLYLKDMEQQLLREENILYHHLTDNEWRRLLTTNVQELRKWTLASASFSRYIRRLEIGSRAHQRELEELITFIKGHLQELEENKLQIGQISDSSNEEISSNDFEIINKSEVDYEQTKEEWSVYLRKLENQLKIESESVKKNVIEPKIKDFHQILEVNHDASSSEIKENYKKLALTWHPDKWIGKTEAERELAEIKFKEINESYQTLSDSNSEFVFISR